MNKARRVIAVIGLAAIALLYIFFFILAFRGDPNSRTLLFSAFAATIIVPVLLYLLQLIARNRMYYEQQKKSAEEQQEKPDDQT